MDSIIKPYTQLCAPINVLIDVISQCQLQCRYCSSMPFSGRYIPEKRCIEIIQELHELGVWYITLSGGEPFLHPGFNRIIEECLVDKKIPLTIDTNGIELSKDERAYQLAELSSHGAGLDLKISLDSGKQQDNDIARGKFYKVIKGINNVTKYGLNVTICAVIHSGNLNSALSLVSKFYPKVRSFTFFPLIPTPRIRAEAPDLLPKKQDIKKFWRHAQKFQKFWNKQGASITLPFRPIPADESQIGVLNKECSYCYGSITTAYIDENLNVYPCSWTKVPRFLVGSLIKTSFSEAWKSQRTQSIRKQAITAQLCKTINAS